MISRIATACALLGAILLTSAQNGCGEGKCLSICVDGNLTFHLSHPIQGQALTIVVTAPSGGSDPAYCVASTAPGYDCSGTSPVVPHADASGSLQSVESPFFGAGAYRIQINADGAWVVDATFQFDPAKIAGVCKSSCYPAATFEIQN